MTDKLKSDIMHCIGMTGSRSHKPYTRHGKKFFKPWRNYFAEAAPNSEWDALVERGYARRRDRRETFGDVTYNITPDGLKWFGGVIGVTIHTEGI